MQQMIFICVPLLLLALSSGCGQSDIKVYRVAKAEAAAKPDTSWARAELKTVVAAGLMAKEAAAHPNDALTRGELEALVREQPLREPQRAHARG